MPQDYYGQVRIVTNTNWYWKHNKKLHTMKRK